jgi:hypothetical protein
LLQRLDVRVHSFELVRVLEAIATVGRVHALEREIATSLAGRVAVAFDLASLAFVAGDGDVWSIAKVMVSKAPISLHATQLPNGR